MKEKQDKESVKFKVENYENLYLANEIFQYELKHIIRTNNFRNKESISLDKIFDNVFDVLSIATSRIRENRKSIKQLDFENNLIREHIGNCGIADEERVKISDIFFKTENKDRVLLSSDEINERLKPFSDRVRKYEPTALQYKYVTYHDTQMTLEDYLISATNEIDKIGIREGSRINYNKVNELMNTQKEPSKKRKLRI